MITLSTGQGFLFPGQGVQSVDMSDDILEEPEARGIFDRAEEILDIDLYKLITRGPEEELNSTVNAQPAVFVDGIARNELLKKKGYRPDLIVGHSLGEFTGLTAAGALTFKDGLRLVRRRGEISSSLDSKGSMLAVLGLEREEVEKILKEADREVTVANYNSPKQVVVSGDQVGLKHVKEIAGNRGGKTVDLDVSGPFHSPLMEEAQRKLTGIIDRLHFIDPEVPIISSVSGAPERSGSKLKSLIKRQMTDSVDWVSCVNTMVEFGVESTIEVGPGSTLKNLTRRIAPGVDNRTFNEVY